MLSLEIILSFKGENVFKLEFRVIGLKFDVRFKAFLIFKIALTGF